MEVVFGVLVPYAAFLTFVIGFIRKVVQWARSPVPFKITLTGGQQKSLSWVRHDPVESPTTTLGVVVRLAREVLLFRSLFRNERVEVDKARGRLLFSGSRWLWLGALVFHWAFLVIVLRHLRFFFEPVPGWVLWLQRLDGALELGVPTVYLTDLAILGALVYLLARRLFSARIRYLSLPSDYLALGLILAVAITGLGMRLWWRVNPVAAKELVLGLVALSPKIPEGLGWPFYLHLTLVSVLFAYFPFSKMMHMAGVFLSPTRNMKNDNRMRRHVNPWDYPVKVHTYQEWEEEFREALEEVGLPLEGKGDG